ncbi:MAG: sulfurtransferase-like selenium metabolism protein YedF [Clostridium beijerinckii]|jgi:selenium metabolism protein YedF|uniref:sulfurtransferase-like selenium metabolism protein YedF n=1 Tax=Clostridium beijerinckii TaxID=1520 RepID=UPI00242D1EAE|nr:sulfurtransferase-like selenium metabolism protein YedF [Clostridium beijerinckii]MCI1478368.1 sulfurtransferase-like selenium metabolism protein YedF [Clostridium beijerinckii]MCI1579083.1 sulfurtransferase-like selenium metabolism protein YedF [Clostridium beijerinckii]MCI1582850.1 sulfurtransferase-like selenium metabolism protein YedF [Clostridium beijerinckii]MCI1623890.1 sulfurtransferase-like selenium metabolism protein YedF [Clostridium beijerinckii]MDG5855303.1 sulfurtransferase-li
MNKVIDAKGKECPMPVIMAKKEIDDGNNSFVVEVDNDIAVQNLKKLANNQGFAVSVEEENSLFKVYFSKDLDKLSEVEVFNETSDKLEENKTEIGNWSVFIGKEIIGAGNEELGKSLIKMYLYTISESDNLPKSILFMNDGVKVPTLNHQAAEHLRDLETKGVEILVCGACLNFYGLEEKLKVGKVSNMYYITNCMKEASKVITL